MAEVTIVNACVKTSDLTNGFVLFQIVNPTNTSQPYVIEFENFPIRSTTTAAFGQAVRESSGRLDWVYDYPVRTGSTVVKEGAPELNCD